jgi:photosystem II stability/assembly factor-like uncharacterized protein
VPSWLRALMVVFAAACSSRTPTVLPWTFVVQPLSSGSTSSMRGLSVVDEQVVWASGSGGVVLRSVDGGATWTPRPVPDADSLDFRDIEGFDSLTAFVLSAGEDGRIYRTSDGGATWRLQFRNSTLGAFFDCFAFFSRHSGIAMSDPVEGRFLLVNFADTSWTPLPQPNRPEADSAEAAFASSGTCLTIAGTRAYFATGGGESARVFWSADRGETWHATDTPVPAGSASAGIFSLAFRDEKHGIAIGGDYQKPAQEARLALTTDGGETWRVAGKTSYVSGAAWSRSGAALLAVGTPGTRLSRDRGVTWMMLDSLEYNAVQFASEQVAYAVGPRGRIARLVRN